MKNKKVKLEDFQDIIQLFQQDAEAPLNSAYVDYSMVNRLFLNGGINEQNELMLRLNTYSKQLVLARVCFINQRKGFGTKLFNLLAEYAISNGYETVIVESVLTQEMKNFLLKQGYQLASNYDYEMNWKISV